MNVPVVSCGCHFVDVDDGDVAVIYCAKHKPSCSPEPAPYTVLVSYTPPTRRARMWAWLAIRPNFARPRATKWWPLCPTCTNPVTAFEPRIRQGDEFYDGRYSWKNPDEVKGFALQPCGHEVAHVAWLSATRGES